MRIVLDLNKLHLAFILTGQASCECQCVLNRINLVTGREDVPRFIATVTNNTFVDDVLGELGLLSDNPNVLHTICNERLDKLRQPFRNSRCAVKNDLRAVSHDVHLRSNG